VGKLESTKDNLSELLKPAEESQFDRDRRAELILLSITEKLPNKHYKKKFCKENGVDWDEYLLLVDKWKHVLKRYQDDANNKQTGEAIANILDFYSKENLDG